MLLDLYFHHARGAQIGSNNETPAPKRQAYTVDRFSDWPIKPKRTDDEECLMLMMI